MSIHADIRARMRKARQEDDAYWAHRPKSCPFCRFSDIHLVQHHPDHSQGGGPAEYCYVCAGCGASGPSKRLGYNSPTVEGAKALALAAWNLRTP